MSKDSQKRSELLAAMGHDFRQLSTVTILFHQAIADRLGMHLTDHKCGDSSTLRPPRSGDLAQRTGLTTGAITGVIDRLEKAGFVRRGKDPGDRRLVIIEPFAEKIEKVIAPLFGSVAQMMTDLSPATATRKSPSSATSSFALIKALTRRSGSCEKEKGRQSMPHDSRLQ